MNRHLEDDQIAAAVAGLDLEPDAQSHLGSCLSCRQQVEEMKGLIDSRRQELLSGEPDWEQQREEILMRLPGVTEAAPSKKWRWMRPLLAAAAVLLTVIGLRVLWVPGTSVEPQVADDIDVENILAEVDAVLADDYLPGFESIDPGVNDPESMIENGAS
jgi:hypothetical protein